MCGHGARSAAPSPENRTVRIARRADVGVSIIAKTLPEEGASTRILSKLGFSRTGIAADDKVGAAWLWTLSPAQ